LCAKYGIGGSGREKLRTTAHELIASIGERLGNERIVFYPGISYRNILKLKGYQETSEAVCTPPHDIPGKPIAAYLPAGKGSALLNDLMERSKEILKDHETKK